MFFPDNRAVSALFSVFGGEREHIVADAQELATCRGMHGREMMAFAILVPLGVMNVAAMVVIALLVFGEKCLPAGNRLARTAALVLVVYGLAVTAIPTAFPTTVS